MIVAKKFVDKTKKTKQKLTQKSKVFFPLLIISIVCFLVSAFCIFLNQYNLNSPNILFSNYIFYIIITLNLILSIIFIFQNYKIFNFDLTFTFALLQIFLALFYGFLFGKTIKAIIFILGLLIMLTSYIIKSEYKILTKVSASAFSFINAFNIYIFVLSIFIVLVN